MMTSRTLRKKKNHPNSPPYLFTSLLRRCSCKVRILFFLKCDVIFCVTNIVSQVREYVVIILVIHLIVRSAILA